MRERRLMAGDDDAKRRRGIAAARPVSSNGCLRRKSRELPALMWPNIEKLACRKERSMLNVRSVKMIRVLLRAGGRMVALSRA